MGMTHSVNIKITESLGRSCLYKLVFAYNPSTWEDGVEGLKNTTTLEHLHKTLCSVFTTRGKEKEGKAAYHIQSCIEPKHGACHVKKTWGRDWGGVDDRDLKPNH